VLLLVCVVRMILQAGRHHYTYHITLVLCVCSFIACWWQDSLIGIVSRLRYQGSISSSGKNLIFNPLQNVCTWSGASPTCGVVGTRENVCTWSGASPTCGVVGTSGYQRNCLWHNADHAASYTPPFALMVWRGTTLFLTDHIALSMHKKVCHSLEN
jgi:hypothetical protein